MPSRTGKFEGNDELMRRALAAVHQLKLDLPILNVTADGTELHITLYGGRMVIWPPRGSVGVSPSPRQQRTLLAPPPKGEGRRTHHKKRV